MDNKLIPWPSSFEEIFDVIGHSGKYQVLLYFIIASSAFMSGQNVGLPIFSEAQLDHICSNGDQVYEFDERCNVTTLNQCKVIINETEEACNFDFIYQREIINSTVSSEFDLVCDKSKDLALLTIVFFVGYAIGPVLGGYICDNFGRRISNILAAVLSMLTVLATTFSVNWYMYAVLRFFTGIASFAAYETGFVFAMEVVGEKYRSQFGFLIFFLFEFGICMLSPMAYYVRNWRGLELLVSCLWMLVIAGNLFIDESPRYLICNNRTEEAEKVLQKIGRLNGRFTRNKTQKLINLDIVAEINDGSKRESGSTVIDLFMNGPEMIRVTIVCMISRLIVGTVYWSLVLNAAALPFSIYTNNFINSLCGIPGYVLANYMVKSPIFGRRLTATSLCCLSGLFTLLSGTFNELGYCMLDSEDRFSDINVILGFIFTLLGRSTISGCLSTWYLWIAELYPTAVRGNAIGICACIEAIAGISSPMLLGLSVFTTWLPSVVSGTLAVFGGLICLLLPETFGKPMVMNLEQAVQLYRST